MAAIELLARALYTPGTVHTIAPVSIPTGTFIEFRLERFELANGNRKNGTAWPTRSGGRPLFRLTLQRKFEDKDWQGWGAPIGAGIPHGLIQRKARRSNEPKREEQFEYIGAALQRRERENPTLNFEQLRGTFEVFVALQTRLECEAF